MMREGHERGQGSEAAWCDSVPCEAVREMLHQRFGGEEHPHVAVLHRYAELRHAGDAAPAVQVPASLAEPLRCPASAAFLAVTPAPGSKAGSAQLNQKRLAAAHSLVFAEREVYDSAGVPLGSGWDAFNGCNWGEYMKLPSRSPRQGISGVPAIRCRSVCSSDSASAPFSLVSSLTSTAPSPGHRCAVAAAAP